jgi:transcriptional regulator of acetoin/glycerol metabolism
MESAARSASGRWIEVSDLPPPLAAIHARSNKNTEIPSLIPVSAPQAAAVPNLEYNDEEDGPLLKHFEKKALLFALHQTGWDKLGAAKLAGVGKSTFYRKLKTHGIK